MKILKFSAPFVTKYLVNFCIYNILYITLWVLSLYTPYMIGKYLDLIVTNPEVRSIYVFILKIASIWTLQIVLSYISNIILTLLHSNICYEINTNILNHITHLPYRYFDKTNHSYLNQRITADCRVLTGYILGEFQSLIASISSIIFVCYLIATINIYVFVFLLLLLPLYITLYFMFKKSIYTMQYASSEAYSHYYSSIEDLLANIKTIKIHQWQNNFFVKIAHSFSNMYRLNLKNAKVGYLFTNIDTIIRYLANVVIFLYAGIQVANGEMSLGELTTINTYTLAVISSLSKIVQFGKRHSQVSVSFDRIQTLYQEKEEACGASCIDNVSKISINNLSFSYGNIPIIANLSVTLTKGKLYALIGENGSGKSTMMHILCGLEQDYTGSIKFNDIDLRQLNLKILREHNISIVEQEPNLIFSTLRENLSTSNKRTDIDYWISEFGLEAYIHDIDKDMKVQSESGKINLSGGEKQKLSLIRAFCKNANILFLDEPSSALDADGIVSLCRALQNIKKDKIVIVATHDDIVHRICDETILL